MMEPMHKYENLDYLDYQVEAGSHTEVEDSLMGDEKRWHHQDPEQSRRSRAAALFNSYRWIIDTSLLVTILVLLLRDRWREPPTNQWDFGGDFTGVGPRCKSHLSLPISPRLKNSH